MKRVIVGVATLVIASLAVLVAQRGETSRQVEWLYYGGDQGGMKHSPLTDINPQNIQRLQLAWQWKHWETPLEEYKTFPGFFEATPLMIDGVLYVTTPYNSIAALDAETGKELWRFDGEAYKLGQLLSSSGWKLRGTAFWRDGNNVRIFLNSRHRLFALDAKTGKPIPSFGTNGWVPLTDLPRISDITHFTQSSPPVVRPCRHASA
jgi:glucose dehydrogenase